MESKELPTVQATEVAVEEKKPPEMTETDPQTQESTDKEQESKVDTSKDIEMAAKTEENLEDKSNTVVETTKMPEEDEKPSDSKDGAAAVDVVAPSEAAISSIDASTVQEPTPEEQPRDVDVTESPVTDVKARDVTGDGANESVEAPPCEKLEAGVDTAKLDEDEKADEAVVTASDNSDASATGAAKVEESATDAPEKTDADASTTVVTEEPAKEESGGDKVEKLPTGVSAPVVQTDASSAAEGAKEPENPGTKIEANKQEIDKKDQEPISVEAGTADAAPNVQPASDRKEESVESSTVIDASNEVPQIPSVPKASDEAAVIVAEKKEENSEGQEVAPRDLDAATAITEAATVGAKASEAAEVAKETSATEAGAPEVVEEKKRTLEGLLLAEKNTEKEASVKPAMSEDSYSAPVAEDIAHQDQEKASAVAEDVDRDGNAENTTECTETVHAKKDNALGATDGAEDLEVKEPGTSDKATEEPAHGAETVADDKNETENNVTERDVVEPTKDDGTGKKEEAQKADTPVKPSQRNIISKMKQSIVKVKKAIIGKSPSSKTMQPVEKDDVKVK